MLLHPQIDPVALQIGPLAVHWYGLTYLAAFGLFLWLGSMRLRHPPFACAPTLAYAVSSDLSQLCCRSLFNVPSVQTMTHSEGFYTNSCAGTTRLHLYSA